MTLWKWSKTAGSNDTADSTINAREGMAPSALNDSLRSMMAAVAKYRDDIGGAVTTGGSSTAYTLSTNQSLSSPADGTSVSFIAHATSGASPTLNVDSGGSKNLVGQTGQALPTGTLIAGTPYRVTLQSGEWRLFGYFAATTTIPIGAMMPFVGTTAPNSSFVLPYGQAISRTTYSSLFAICGTAFGAGDGSTTFNLPDLRGRAIFGKDDMGGSAASRITNAGSGIVGTTTGANGGAQSVSLAQANLPNVNFTGTSGGRSVNHTHSITPKYTQCVVGSGGFSVYALVDATSPTITGNAPTALTTGNDSVDHTHSLSVASGGSGTAVNNMPPALIVPWLIRVI